VTGGTYNRAMHPWRDRLARWLFPVALNSPLTPNELSLLALLLNVMAAVLLFDRFFLLAIAFIAVGGLLDALDGIVARVQHMETAFGDFLDHCLDRISDSLIAAGWLLGNAVHVRLVVAAIIVIMMNGYVGTQIEATFRERNYESVGRGEFVLALIVFPIVSSILFRNGWDGWRFADLTIAEWMTVLLIVFALLGIVQRFALARRLSRS
jgi:phosphatidylglycerophosphate synthase